MSEGARRAREVGGGSVIVLCGNGRTLFSDAGTEHNTVLTRGGHRHLQIGRMLDIDLISEPPRPLPIDVCI
jgi:hypothetical protein